LHYFDGDYPAAIGGNNAFIGTQISTSDLYMNSSKLYNGNIGAMVTTITDPSSRTALPLGNAYKYDQLNRIKESKSFNSLHPGANQWGSGQAAMYSNTFTYDANGNIATQTRYDASGALIDNLNYKYKDIAGTIGTTNPKKHNRLYSVNDTQDYNDLDIHTGQATNNYVYDAEGRLIADAQEKISNIIWRVDGKVKKVVRTPGFNKKNISFDYDALGHRIAKHIYSDGDVLEKSVYYILDAQGNTMSVYERSINTDASSISYTQIEKHIYGTSRLGVHTERIALLGTQNQTYSAANLKHRIGDKNYELSNHLGNVLAVISDKVIPHVNGSVVDYCQADIRQATDYSPFGVVLDGRNFEPAPYTETYPTTQVIYSNDFESSTVVVSGSTTTVDGWYNFSASTLSIDNTVTKRVKVVSTNGTHGANRFFAVATGASHTLSIKVDKGTASTVNIVIFYNCPSMTSNAGSPSVAYSAVNGINTFNFTSTTGYVFIQVRQTGTYYFDDVSIVNNAAVGTVVHDMVHRYGFNGMERDDELKGSGNSYDFGARMVDPRLGRWLTIDPQAIKYPGLSPYCYSGNMPIAAFDPNGKEIILVAASDQHDNSFKFVNAAIRKLKLLNNDESLKGQNKTLVLVNINGFYSAKAIERINKSVKKHGGTLLVVSKKQELLDYVNGTTENVHGECRDIDKILSLQFFAHGTPGSIHMNYAEKGDWSIDKDFVDGVNANEPSTSKDDLFTKDANVKSFACRTGAGINIDKGDDTSNPRLLDMDYQRKHSATGMSLAQYMADTWDVKVYALLERTIYQSQWSWKQCNFLFNNQSKWREMENNSSGGVTIDGKLLTTNGSVTGVGASNTMPNVSSDWWIFVKGKKAVINY